MLSPSHPGPYKATHLAMRDRTCYGNLIASPVVVSNPVGVDCCSTSTDDGAKQCALLPTSHCAYCGARANSDAGGQLVAMTFPKRSVIIPTISASTVNLILVTDVLNPLVISPRAIKPSRSCLCSDWKRCQTQN